MSDRVRGAAINDGRRWTIDCSCHRFQDAGVPCAHAVKAMYYIGERRYPRDFMHYGTSLLKAGLIPAVL